MLKIGIIGCGKITEVRHAPEYAENPNCQLAAFFDVVPERAKALAEQYGGVAYDSIEALLASDVDAVSVCVANAYHAQASIQALKAGKHVLCEKPMATTPEDCEAMVAAAKAAGKFLMIGQNQRLAKAHVKAREIIASGEMGKVITFETHFAHPGPEGWTGVRDSWFFDKKVASFGVMADLGVHKTDLIHYLTGKKIVRTSAVLATLDKTFSDGRPITVDDNAYAIYTMEDGVVGTMHVSWTNYGNENNSTKMYMEGEVIPYELDLLTSNKEQTTGGRTSTGVIDAFVESIITNTPPAISGESAMHAMKVVFANEQSAQLGKAVDVQQ